jgi:ribosomal protein S18 acetylase RimI-like enzyme
MCFHQGFLWGAPRHRMLYKYAVMGVNMQYPELSVRPASWRDLSALNDHMPVDPRLPGGHPERLKAQDHRRCRYLVAWSDGDGCPVGHLIIDKTGSAHDHIREANPGMVEIQRVEVAEKFQGRGVGRYLMVMAHQLLYEHQVPMSGLCVAVHNVGAQRFYARLGYERVGKPFESTRGAEPQEVTFMRGKVPDLVRVLTETRSSARGVTEPGAQVLSV